MGSRGTPPAQKECVVFRVQDLGCRVSTIMALSWNPKPTSSIPSPDPILSPYTHRVPECPPQARIVRPIFEFFDAFWMAYLGIILAVEMWETPIGPYVLVP